MKPRKRLDFRLVDLVCLNAADRWRIDDAIDDARHGERQDRVHVVPQPPRFERPFGASFAAEEAVTEAVEKRIEIVVFDNQNALVGMFAIIASELADDLQAEGGLAAPFFSEDDRRRRVFRAAEDLVPGRMIGAFEAVAFEDLIALGVFLTEGVFFDAVMGQKLLNFHRRTYPLHRGVNSVVANTLSILSNSFRE